MLAPFSGNIIEPSTVGALTSRPYRFRARPWDVEDAGTVFTFCPAQCNVVRDGNLALRVLARQQRRVGPTGWPRDKGRFGYSVLPRRCANYRAAAARRRRAAGGVLGARADGGQRRALARGRAAGAIAAGGTTSEEGLLLARLLRERLDSPHLDSRRAGVLPLARHRALNEPQLQEKVSDLEFAHAVLVLDAEPVNDWAPILDLRLRKGVRRQGGGGGVASPHAEPAQCQGRVVGARPAPAPSRCAPAPGARPEPLLDGRGAAGRGRRRA